MNGDRIELRGLRVLGICGALPEERDRPQPLEVDLDVEVDLAAGGRSDDLADTVDYGALARTVVRVATEGRFTLLERLASRIADEVGVDPRVTSVTVAVRKLRPPVPVDLATAGVRIHRRGPVPDRGPERPSERGARTAGAAGTTGRHRAFLGLGSNLGDREARLREAVAGLPDVVAVSPLYETEPVGGAPGQPLYLNAVVELRTDLGPRDLLERARALEEAAGRLRAEPAGPRTLDVDVLLVGDLRAEDPDLVVPHPRMYERRFVLAPLADIAPELVPDGWEREAGGAVRRVGTL